MDTRPLAPAGSPLQEILRSLRTWPDSDLTRLAREVGYELLRRNRAVPVALPVGEAMSGLSTEYPVPGTQFSLAIAGA